MPKVYINKRAPRSPVDRRTGHDETLEELLDYEDELEQDHRPVSLANWSGVDQIAAMLERSANEFESARSSSASTSQGDPAQLNPAHSGNLWQVSQEPKINQRGLRRLKSFPTDLYRFDRRSPDSVLREGFLPSEDFTAIENMRGEEKNHNTLIVADDAQGTVRYRNLVVRDERGYIYRISGRGVHGVSLMDNVTHNSTGLQAFLETEDRLDTEEELLSNTNTASALHEAHVKLSTVTPDKISVARPEDLPPLDHTGVLRNYL